MAPKYSTEFYQTVGADVPHSAARVVPIVREFVSPRSVVDVGCGSGSWLAEFHKNGATEIQGLDGPWISAAQLRIPAERFRVTDVGEPIREGRQFDLVVCLETAEHLIAAQAATLIESLVSLGSVVLFSAAIPLQGGYNHFNEQWPDYWAALFAKHGYRFIDCLRSRLWNDPAVEWWYAQNMFFVVNEQRLADYPALAAAAAAETWPHHLALVHPRAYLQNAVWGKAPSELLQATLGATKRALRSRHSSSK